MQKLDDTKAIQITDDIWWVGFADYEAGFSNNPYLLVDNGEAILFDPGPAHLIFRDIILRKIQQVIDPKKIKYIVLHHQDPDLCGLIPSIENILHPNLIIIAHPRTALFIPYYGIRRSILPVGDDDVLVLKSGRKIKFYHTPYVHFAGSMVSYDCKSESLFSSDIFAAFDREWSLYATDAYLELVKNFIEHYVYGREPVLYVYEKLKKLKIQRILPQHGGIIKDNIEKYLNVLKEAIPGQLLTELKNRPTPYQEKKLFEAGKSWLEHWLKKEIKAKTLDNLMDIAMKQGPSSVSLLIDNLSKISKDFGILNPLTYGHVHKWNNIQTTKSTNILNSIRKKFLIRQYGILFGKGHVDKIIQNGLISFKANIIIMFIDIRGFTKWSFLKSPQKIVTILNKQHELISRAIYSGGGRINKLMGDGILAYFTEDRINHSITAAVKIHKIINKSKLLPVGIGLDFGEVIIGDIGEDSRLDYTLIGSTVNFASRMCDNAEKGEIIITNRIYEKISNKLKERIDNLPTFKKTKVKIKPTDPKTDAIKF